MSILNAYRCRFDSLLVKYILSSGNTVSNSMFLYTVGLLRSAPFSNDLFGVWAALLVSFLFGTNYAALYGHVQWNLEIGAAVPSMIYVGDLYGASEANFGTSLWFLLALKLLRITYMYIAFLCACKSYWKQYSSVLLSDYMWTENEDSSKERNDPIHSKCMSRNSTRSSNYNVVYSERSNSRYYCTRSRNYNEVAQDSNNNFQRVVETQKESSSFQEVNQRATEPQVIREIEEV